MTEPKEPPCSPEAEQYVLSCCLLDGRDAIETCINEGLKPAAFFSPANSTIYQHVLLLYKQDAPVELESVVIELKSSGKFEDIGGMQYIIQVSDAAPTTAKMGYFIKRITEMHTLRSLIQAAQRTIEQCHEIPEDFPAFIDAAEQSTLEVTEAARSDGQSQAQSMEELAESTIHDFRQLAKGLDTSAGDIRTGLDQFDRDASLIGRDELVVVGARPSVGKSAFGCFVANTAMRDRKKVAIFTLESSSKSVLSRLTAQRTEVNIKEFSQEFPDKQQRFLDEMRDIAESGLLKVYDRDLTLDSIAARCRILANTWQPDLVVIDYLNIIRTTFGRSQYERITHISTEMIALRKTLDCPLMVLAQFNRAPASEGRAPTMADFRDSGKVEEDAHRIIAIHRPAKDDNGMEQDQSSANQLLELHQLKNREGPCAYGRTRFVPKHTRFIP